ncbi:hypothetical protein Emtol_0472 [Emticicia oligotrophica DSM 17448]|uniref:Uncharacterized protein n=1 Tax=Emticicia oligotrophica (strain DSM 17448 / CIP 109782 / MTCC 6937 / GPTSA100-15) TaxID=929562 RepID=A0ABM5MX00_EMTOG|nr:hypothetical protein Emtol_0472 [Emticicia oligotrophica DSM 17448]
MLNKLCLLIYFFTILYSSKSMQILIFGNIDRITLKTINFSRQKGRKYLIFVKPIDNIA